MSQRFEEIINRIQGRDVVAAAVGALVGYATIRFSLPAPSEHGQNSEAMQEALSAVGEIGGAIALGSLSVWVNSLRDKRRLAKNINGAGRDQNDGQQGN